MVKAELAAIDPWMEVTPRLWWRSVATCATIPALRFDMLNCVSGVDYFQTDPKKAAKVEWQPHVEVVYHLSSTITKQRLVLKVTTALEGRRGGPVARGAQRVRRVATADWHEREVFDLMGVRFTGHPDLRRILCPEDWVGHPLRKDYQPPEYTTGSATIDSRAPTYEELSRMSTMNDPRIVEFDVRTDEMLVNMGPQHPSTHGVLRLVLRTDGEVVSESSRTSATCTAARRRSART